MTRFSKAHQTAVRIQATSFAILCLMSIPALAQAPAPWANGPATAQAPILPTTHASVPASLTKTIHTDSTLTGGMKPGDSLHLVQKAWQNPKAHEGIGQTAPGYISLDWTPSKVLPLHTREGLITTVTFPSDETIVQLITSDPQAIEAVPSPDKHKFAVKPVYPGIDGSIIVYGSTGNTYNFYLTSEPYDAPTIADTIVTVDVPHLEAKADRDTDTVPYPPGYHHIPNTLPIDYGDDPSASLTQSRAAASRSKKDFNAIARTGAGRIRTDLRIYAAHKGDSIIAPVAAWRDDKFTYLDFGPRAASMNTWPVAALVVDKVESPVGTRVAGADRSILVVEAIGDIVLRDGPHVVCIKLDDVYDDPRHPKADEVYRDRPDIIRTAATTTVPATPLPTGPLRITPKTASGAGGLITGPYRVNAALMLASDIVKGYHGKVPAEQIHIETLAGANLSKAEIMAAPASRKLQLRIDASTHAQARMICSDLRHTGRPCRLK